jgi:hypothetical protein
MATEILTPQDGQKVSFVNVLKQFLAADFLDTFVALLIDDPVEDIPFVEEVT